MHLDLNLPFALVFFMVAQSVAGCAGTDDDATLSKSQAYDCVTTSAGVRETPGGY